MKRSNIVLFIIIPITSLWLSCNKNHTEERLKEAVYGDIAIEDAVISNGALNGIVLEQYKDMELKHNVAFVNEMNQIVSSGFEKQLEEFDDKELGFFAGYGYMLDFIFKSDDEWENDLRLKSDKYFNTVDIEQEMATLYLAHIAYTKQLRSQLLKTKKVQKSLVDDITPLLQLPEQNIYLGDLQNHAGVNLLIEVTTEMAQWLLFIFIGWLIVFLIGLPVSAGILSIIATIISVILSIIVTYRNDNKLLDAIKEQQVQALVIDSDEMLDRLNENTIKFYESIR